MATNRRFMPVPPDAVWEALADPMSYRYWVVGSKQIRDADENWPEVGSKLHHTVGAGPIKVSDHTQVVESEPGERLVLRAKARPTGTARVTMRLEPRPEDGGTDVVMTENPDGPFAALAINPLTHVFTIGRNAETLMRLEELALLNAADRGLTETLASDRSQSVR